MEPPRMVDDRFWLEQARLFLVGGREARDRAAERLTAAVAWFWSVYTAAALVGSALRQATPTTVQTVIIALPALALVVSYLLASHAAMPVEISFDPRMPHEIILAHKQSVDTKARRLVYAWSAIVVSALTVAAAIAATDFPSDDAARKALGAKIVDGPGGPWLKLSGEVGGKGSVSVVVRTVDNPNGDDSFTQSIPLGASGEFAATLRLRSSSRREVTLSWVEDRTLRTARMTTD